MGDSPSDDHVAFGPVTPWEKTTFSRLPQRSESEPCVPRSRKNKPGRTVSIKAPRPARRSVTQQSDGSLHRGTPPPEDGVHKQQVLGSLSVNTSPRPYETTFSTSTTASDAQNSPPCRTDLDNKTLPESVGEKSVTSSEDQDSPNVLPGTMSARNARSKASARQPSPRRKTKPTKAGTWKVVFRTIFAKNPVDESQFERIEDRHWTDE